MKVISDSDKNNLNGDGNPAGAEGNTRGDGNSNLNESYKKFSCKGEEGR